MIVKQIPSDFIVREMAELNLAQHGEYSVYLLRKAMIGTLEAVRKLSRMFRTSPANFGIAGLKDTMAVTEQFVSLRNGPERSFESKAFSLEFLGRSDRPVSADRLIGNVFHIALRKVARKETAGMQKALWSAVKFGVPNYFDQQRMGSAKSGEGFVARRLIDGDFEGALKLFLAAPSPKDPPEMHRAKAFLEKNWGKWVRAAELMPPHLPESVVLARLCGKPGDFKGAVLGIERRLLALMLYAYQSHVWNRCVARYLGRLKGLGGAFKSGAGVGRMLFYDGMDVELLDRLREETFPLVDHRSSIADPRKRWVVGQVLAEDGLTVGGFRVKELKHVSFGCSERRMLFFPEAFASSGYSRDELNKGSLKLTLDFSLRKGSYATLLLKRIEPRRRARAGGH
jgi:tRNA pseudouridine13 synthase